ncbi:hypothetical protein B0F90DRAFT_1720486, partial [Multifurca ochricompacta]
SVRKRQRPKKKKEKPMGDTTCVCIGRASCFRAGTKSTNSVRGCPSDDDTEAIGNGPWECGLWSAPAWPRKHDTYRIVRRKRSSGLTRVRVAVSTTVQLTLTRKPGIALNLLPKVGGSKRPSEEVAGTTRRKENWSVLLPPPWTSRTQTEASNYP